AIDHDVCDRAFAVSYVGCPASLIFLRVTKNGECRRGGPVRGRELELPVTGEHFLENPGSIRQLLTIGPGKRNALGESGEGRLDRLPIELALVARFHREVSLIAIPVEHQDFATGSLIGNRDHRKGYLRANGGDEVRGRGRVSRPNRDIADTGD